MSVSTTTPTIYYRDGSGPEDLPELNATLLFDLVRWAEMDEQDIQFTEAKFRNWGHWYQGHWAQTEMPELTEEERQALRNGACQTSYCIAGQAVHQGGYRLDYESDGYANNVVQQRMTDLRTPRGVPIWEDVPGAQRQDIAEVAQELLGLTSDEAGNLFGGDNEVGHLKQYANLFALARRLPPLFADADIYRIERDESIDYWTDEELF